MLFVRPAHELEWSGETSTSQFSRYHACLPVHHVCMYKSQRRRLVWKGVVSNNPGSKQTAEVPFLQPPRHHRPHPGCGVGPPDRDKLRRHSPPSTAAKNILGNVYPNPAQAKQPHPPFPKFQSQCRSMSVHHRRRHAASNVSGMFPRSIFADRRRPLCTQATTKRRVGLKDKRRRGK